MSGMWIPGWWSSWGRGVVLLPHFFPWDSSLKCRGCGQKKKKRQKKFCEVSFPSTHSHIWKVLDKTHIKRKESCINHPHMKREGQDKDEEVFQRLLFVFFNKRNYQIMNPFPPWLLLDWSCPPALWFQAVYCCSYLWAPACRWPLPDHDLTIFCWLPSSSAVASRSAGVSSLGAHSSAFNCSTTERLFKKWYLYSLELKEFP